MKHVSYVVSLLLIVGCSTKPETTQTTNADTVRAAVDSPARIEAASSGKSVSKSSPSVRAGTWAYEEQTAPTGGRVYKASITSPDVLQFGFPYAGGSTAMLTIRKRDDNTNVYLEVSKGQFNRSFEGGNARIRFDGKPAQSYSFSAAENGRANIIFFDAEQRLINQMKAARIMIIEIGFYAQGTRQISFNTAGLKWNR